MPNGQEHDGRRLQADGGDHQAQRGRPGSWPGAVEATPITIPESIPSAPERRPFSPACPGSSRTTASAIRPISR